MSYCNTCRKYGHYCRCSTVVSNTTINSDQAGRDGLSAYDIAIRTGKFTGTEAEFIDWNRGEKGDKGDKGDPGEPGLNGDSVYTNTEW